VDSDEDSNAYIKPAKKTKLTAMAQPLMMDFFKKKLAGSKLAVKLASSTTACKASESMKPPPKKVVQGSNNKISINELQLELHAPTMSAPSHRWQMASSPAREK